MSIIIGNGMLLSYDETEGTCPICEQIFDASQKIEKSKHPVFNTRCPKCKGKITISTPVFGGTLKFFETECPATIKRLETETPNKVNGRIPRNKFFDDNADDYPDVLV